jgi:hypothetical protein
MTADRDTTLPPELSKAIGALRDRAYDLGSIRYDPRERGRDAGPDKKRMDAAAAALESAILAALREARAQGIEEAAALSGREGQSWIAARIRALSSPGSAPVAPEGRVFWCATHGQPGDACSDPGCETGWEPAPETPAPSGRCSVCGSQRIPLTRNRTMFGACSLVPGRDGKGGCPDPLRDVMHEEIDRAAAAPAKED